MSELQKRPKLYHASPNGVIGEYLEPRDAHTCVRYQFFGTPKQSEHEGKMIFAGANLASAYTYAFKVHDPVRQENGKPYCYMATMSAIAKPNEGIIPCAVIADRAQFFERLSQARPMIYQMPDFHSFVQVHDRDGNPMGEWVSREHVPLDMCPKIEISGLDEAMQKGAQFFFLKEGVSKEKWYELSNQGWEKIFLELEPLKTDPLAYKQATSQALASFMKQMVDSGLLEHYNAERNICPVDLSTRDFMPGLSPDLFSSHCGRSLSTHVKG